jgi:hypothetical protein
LYYFGIYDRINVVRVDSMGIVLGYPFRKRKGDDAMNTLEILTLLLVVFAALSYIDNHHNRK